ncbi:hypothetical protein SBV1_3060003 [Verrucomicrobia bacterium]|nr:hypothetical protein SBV1_3060003 [Verrucomicrobiota bacterium]
MVESLERRRQAALTCRSFYAQIVSGQGSGGIWTSTLFQTLRFLSLLTQSVGGFLVGVPRRNKRSWPIANPVPSDPRHTWANTLFNGR